MKNKNALIDICEGGLLAALYIVTTVINPIGFGIIQLRISAIVSIIPFFQRKFKLPCILAVAIANLFSPLGFVDVVVGIVLWTLAYYVVDFAIKNIYIKCLVVAILSGLLIGAELWYIVKSPFIFNFISIFISQSIVFLIAIFLLQRILKTKSI
jgi:uncharacterized membrane protein